MSLQKITFYPLLKEAIKILRHVCPAEQRQSVNVTAMVLQDLKKKKCAPIVTTPLKFVAKEEGILNFQRVACLR